MMTKPLQCAAVALCLSFTFAGAAFGQACSANSGTISTPNSPTGVAGNTCGHGSAQTVICTNAETLNGNGLDIYAITVGAGNNFSVTVTSSVFSPELALTTTTTCSGSSPCSIDVSPPGAATSPFSVTGNASGLAVGTHFLFVGDVGTDQPGCGAYNLVVTATLPVELKNFSVD